MTQLIVYRVAIYRLLDSNDDPFASHIFRTLAHVSHGPHETSARQRVYLLIYVRPPKYVYEA